jgi:uncharacterized protein DUF5996
MATPWPPLPLEAWLPTKETLHRYTQIIGKIQLALTPFVNHFWNVTLRVTARGLATSTLRYQGRSFEIELDLVEHRVVVRTSDAKQRTLELRPLAVADFYHDLLSTLESLGIRVTIWDHPVEIRTDLIPFAQDRAHASYDRRHVERFFHVLSNAAEVLEEFRSRFIGKCSGVQFYWGTFDLCVARYSGRRAPDPPRHPIMEREAYSHEVSECGFWPGDVVYPAPAFYALHYPALDGYARAAVRPAAAIWNDASRLFLLPYEACREHDTAAQVLEFCQSTYEAGANLAGWDRTELEYP